MKKFPRVTFWITFCIFSKNYDEIFELLDYGIVLQTNKTTFSIQKDLIIDHFKTWEIIKENEGNVYITNLDDYYCN